MVNDIPGAGGGDAPATGTDTGATDTGAADAGAGTDAGVDTGTVTAPAAEAPAPVVTLEDAPTPLAESVLDTPVAAPAAAPVAAAPAAQADQAAQEDQEVVQIDDGEVPLAVLDEEDPSGVEDEAADGLLNIEDEETPLAAAALGGVQHTVQHLLELGGAGILPIFLAGSNRKKKKEVSELKEQLKDREEN